LELIMRILLILLSRQPLFILSYYSSVQRMVTSSTWCSECLLTWSAWRASISVPAITPQVFGFHICTCIS
jgi:hypothetical protein